MGYTPLKLTTEYYLLKIGRKWPQKNISSSNHWRSGAFAVDFREGKLPKTNSSPLKNSPSLIPLIPLITLTGVDASP